MKLDVAFIHVSPPDSHGYCSLGVSVEASVAAIENAKIVVAQVNPQMPRTFGDGILHVSEIDYLVDVNLPIYAHDVAPFTAEEEKIGAYVASLIEDKSTLQMGIGSIPNAALSKLTNHKDLGLHTEMFSDGVIDLIENDVINCNYKGTLRGRALATFLMGSKRLYDFVDDNPFIEMKESSMVNDTARIRRNPRMVAINSAIEQVSTQRSALGAVQNRLEHTIKNLDTSAENLQASESRIRDVDMAKEMMNFTKNNILTQAAQAMLAQANQAPQGVLQLLR